MSNKTILIPNTTKDNNSLTNFNKVNLNPYDDFQKQKSTFKRNKLNKLKEYAISYNPFISCATPLFKYMLEIKENPNQDNLNIDEVREVFISKINIYNEEALKNGIENTEVLVTRYILCTYIDETMNTTYLGRDNNWSNNSLLEMFHNETYGGENFFHLLDKFLKTPAKYIHILELMHICLSLGFEGKYRVMSRGQIELNNIKGGLFKQIKIVQGRDPLTFYTNQEASKEKYRLFYKVPYSILATSIFLILFIIYSVLTFTLHNQDEEFLNILKETKKSTLILNIKEDKE